MQQNHVFSSGYNGGEMANVPEMEPRSRADSEPGTTTAGESVVPDHGSQTIGPGAIIRVRPNIPLPFNCEDRLLMNFCACMIA